MKKIDIFDAVIDAVSTAGVTLIAFNGKLKF